MCSSSLTGYFFVICLEYILLWVKAHTDTNAQPGRYVELNRTEFSTFSRKPPSLRIDILVFEQIICTAVDLDSLIKWKISFHLFIYLLFFFCEGNYFRFILPRIRVLRNTHQPRSNTEQKRISRQEKTKWGRGKNFQLKTTNWETRNLAVLSFTVSVNSTFLYYFVLFKKKKIFLLFKQIISSLKSYIHFLSSVKRLAVVLDLSQ